MPSIAFRAVALAGSLSAVLAALWLPASAAAGKGFGYHDPRSFQIHAPSDVAATADGGALLSTYSGKGPIRKFVPGKRPKVVAGGGDAEVGTEPAPATSVSLFGSDDLSVMPDGGFLDAEGVQGDIVEIRDGEARRLAPSLRQPGAIAAGDGGDFLVTTGGEVDAKIREVGPGGPIRTVAGNGEFGLTPDGEQAEGSPLLYVLDVAYLPDGGIVFAEWAADYAAIREIRPDGKLETLAGGHGRGFSGDGGPAVDATLGEPFEIAVEADGSILIADGNRVRRIGTDGAIDTVAGTGKPRYNGDGIPATEANISADSLAAGPDGTFLVGDFGNGRIRRVSAGGTIRTIVGMPAPYACPKATYNGIQGGTEDGVEKIGGSPLRDLILGEAGDDQVTARSGADCVDGGQGDDRIRGGPGRDTIDAQAGRDTIHGEEGDDSLFGGFDDDHLVGGKGDDLLDGNTGADHFEGEGGDDYIDAQYNERESSKPVVDRIDCGPGRDTVKANTYDDIAKNCEIVKGAAGRAR